MTPGTLPDAAAPPANDAIPAHAPVAAIVPALLARLYMWRAKRGYPDATSDVVRLEGLDAGPALDAALAAVAGLPRDGQRWVLAVAWALVEHTRVAPGAHELALVSDTSALMERAARAAMAGQGRPYWLPSEHEATAAAARAQLPGGDVAPFVEPAALAAALGWRLHFADAPPPALRLVDVLVLFVPGDPDSAVGRLGAYLALARALLTQKRKTLFAEGDLWALASYLAIPRAHAPYAAAHRAAADAHVPRWFVDLRLRNEWLWTEPRDHAPRPAPPWQGRTTDGAR